MKEKEFEKLIDKNKYQVFLFTCPCTFPLTFARHPWFVINKKGIISRWEILYRLNQCETSWGHLHLNLYEPTESLKIFLKIKGNAKLIKSITGDENSLAHQIAEFIETSPKEYLFNEYYSLIGPNSNTYAQWVLDNFEDFGGELPFNAFGKNFNVNLLNK